MDTQTLKSAKTAHTAGPWSNMPMQDTIWANDGNVKVAKACDLPWKDGKSDWITENANARLIAAAPELLSALQLLENAATACVLKIDPEHDSEACALTQALILARVAIDKAIS